MSEEVKAVTKAAWKRAAQHYVTCPSGVTVGIRLPDLPEMLKTGKIPNDLVDAAIASINGAEPTRELIEQQADFYHLLILDTVVEPKLEEADVADIPYEDKEMLVEFATRQRDLDAVGNHLGGLHKSSDFRRFRRLGHFDEDVEGL